MGVTCRPAVSSAADLLSALVRACAIACVTVVLSACPGGGNSDDSDSAMMPPPPPEPIALVSKNDAGFASDSTVQDGDASADGRYIAFSADATNLVVGDSNGVGDVFVHDAQTGTTIRASVTDSGAEADLGSFEPVISADGGFIAFSSGATNLIVGDVNMVNDIFVHDRLNRTTARVSVDSAGNPADGQSVGVSISGDGRYVAFSSEASNLVAGDTNMARDIFVHDRQAGTTVRASVDSSGNQGNAASSDPAISSDGRHVAFSSRATNFDAGDTNNETDIFVHDLLSATTTRVSVGSSGAQSDDFSLAPEISADGRYVAWYSGASNLVANDTNRVDDIFLRDTLLNTTTRVSVASDGSQGDDASDTLAISGDGRYLAFYSDAENLIAADTNGEADTFVHDTQTGATYRVSRAADGSPANDFSQITGISADGRYVLFYSPATNLDPAASGADNQLFRAPNLMP